MGQGVVCSVVSSESITFTGTLILPADVDWLKTISVEVEGRFGATEKERGKLKKGNFLNGQFPPSVI